MPAVVAQHAQTDEQSACHIGCGIILHGLVKVSGFHTSASPTSIEALLFCQPAIRLPCHYNVKNVSLQHPYMDSHQSKPADHAQDI